MGNVTIINYGRLDLYKLCNKVSINFIQKQLKCIHKRRYNIRFEVGI